MKVHQFFFFLLLLFLPVQLGYHFWPEWTLVLGRRVDYLSPTVYLTDITIFFMLAFWLIKRISNIKYQISNIYIKNQKAWIAFSLLLFVSLLNIWFAASKPAAIYKWIKALEFIGLGWYIIKTKPKFPVVCFLLSIGVLYSSFIAMAQFFLQHSIGGPLWLLGERTFNIDTPGIARVDLNLSFITYHLSLFKLRPYATFPHPNVLGGYLAAALPLIIYKLTNLQINKFTKWEKRYYLIALVAGLIALALTFSRSAWVAGILGVGIVYYGLRRKQKKIFPLILNIVPLILLALLVFVSFNKADESIVVRQQLNTAALRLWRQSPVVGIGLGNFLVKLPETLPSRQIYFLQPVHNIYLLVLAELGLVGLGLFGLLICFAVRNYELRIKKHGKEKTSATFIVHGSLFIILLLGLVDHYPLTLQQGQLLLTLFISLSLAVLQ